MHGMAVAACWDGDASTLTSRPKYDSRRPDNIVLRYNSHVTRFVVLPVASATTGPRCEPEVDRPRRKGASR